MEIILGDCTACAELLGIAPELIQTVARVESQGDLKAFLYEPHVFSRLTNHRYDETRPDISYPKWDRTKYPRRREDRLIQFGKAVAVEPLKAYESASWGLFQIMGFNYKVAGYTSAISMSTELQSSVEANVSAFGKVIQHLNLLDTIKAKEWEKFARIYNGPGYKLNNYHIKMQNEYERITNT
jgi:hypothetical protein